MPVRLAIVVVLLLALGAPGCGSDDDAGRPGPAATDASEPHDSDEDQARATVERLYASMRAGDADGVCANLSEPAQKQVAAGGIGVGEGATCAEAFQEFFDAADRKGGLNLILKAKVRKIALRRDRGEAKVSFGRGRVGEVPLVKVDGEWKLDRVGATQ
jgi:hypothetical protein